ncbi:hypothetical protein [Rhizobium terrae]|uniref:hypothetical protein n=1 Tax=Rhizobium terrae TaxID=2171756 RepID=UPI0013C2D2FA|nr:hypothetical protein [Rhizobium terrae]
MNQSMSAGLRLPLVAAVSLLLLALGGVAFFGWLRFGASILLTLGETGLSWCF